MRHDPASAAVVIMLRSLKMDGMAQAVTDLIEQGAPAFDAAVPILSQLLKSCLCTSKNNPHDVNGLYLLANNAFYPPTAFKILTAG
ncbi:hypothetical protein GGI59_006053 [Rhizobium lentis]|uniref:Uncharacterized protein n=1 Tax=Rhizobium lentis TaxID=1138194 RepID=A0A7W9CYD7_9HYPH|nr:hypothetical protein [Rhizobium lentis]MBB5553784.1 hypothetical protein [Rhizobium lentis]MBB5564345.1 hypothetical protein [Rhizobium lentis]MBB5570855.1 hypothetical protein [Rhizobium lentis]